MIERECEEHCVGHRFSRLDWFGKLMTLSRLPAFQHKHNCTAQNVITSTAELLNDICETYVGVARVSVIVLNNFVAIVHMANELSICPYPNLSRVCQRSRSRYYAIVC
jgi:hypothetical protein